MTARDIPGIGDTGNPFGYVPPNSPDFVDDDGDEDHMTLLMDDLSDWVDTFKGAVKSGSKRRADQAQDFIVSILKSAKEAMK